MIKPTIAVLAATLATGCGNPDTPKKEHSQPEARPEQHETMPGGFSLRRAPDEEEIALFRRMTEGLTGVAYTPDSVATQVVAGTNYRFVCTAKSDSPAPEEYRVEIVVFRPLPGRGDARITLLKRL